MKKYEITLEGIGELRVVDDGLVKSLCEAHTHTHTHTHTANPLPNEGAKRVWSR